MLDALEADFRQVYPDSPPPFDEGFEQALRILINELDWDLFIGKITSIPKKSAERLAFFVKKGFEVTGNWNNCVYLCIETGSEDNPEQG